MNPSLFSSHFFIVLFITPTVFSYSGNTIYYTDHCTSFVPEAIPTEKLFSVFMHPFFEAVTSHYTGGQNIFEQDPPLQRSISFAANPIFKTNIIDTYKFQARLMFYSSKILFRPFNLTSGRSKSQLEFFLDGFWSASTNKLCMVGSADWFSKQGNPLKLHAVLKFKLFRFTTFNNSLVSGILESLNSPHDSNYFDTILMLGFPRVSPYNYTLVSNQEYIGLKIKTVQDSVTRMKSFEVCSKFSQRSTTYELEYPSNCKNCSLFGEDSSYLPSFVSLFGIQCSEEDKNIRILVEFRDRRLIRFDQSFSPDISLIGEGTWNETRDELYIVACQILNQSDPLGSARVGDCSMRLTLWFPAFRSIKKTHTTKGQIWTTKITDDTGSFRPVKFQSFDHSKENYGWKYEYTQMEKVKSICPKQKLVGNKYQLGYYGFDISVKHKNMNSTGSVVPIFVGDRMYNYYSIVIPKKASYNSRLYISFEISFILNVSSISESGISSLNLSANNGRVDISAEGFYDDENGQTCMVGCRNLNLNNVSYDCEIVVRFQYPRGNGSFLNGSIESLREKQDDLYFDHIDILSQIYTKTDARKVIWTMELEIIMVFISETLICVSILRQLVHIKKNPEMVNSISVLMMIILTFGHMVPLVLKFETKFSNAQYHQSIVFLQVNEIRHLRLMTVVALILQFRLLQLTWTAKKNHWINEIRTFVICLSMYLFVGSFMLLIMKWKNNSYTFVNYLRCYGGLTLDGFLFPQLILNIFQISKGNALCYSFYIGTTFVRLLPHAYDLYTGPKTILHRFDWFYIYANPRAEFYSPLWDITIVCGGIIFAVTIFLQQLFGGRIMFPKRFRESVLYETVPVTSYE